MCFSSYISDMRAKFACLILSIVLLFDLSISKAQRVFSSLSLDDGLSQTSVTKIIQAPYGYLWFSTQDGLNRYNGHDFTILKKDSYPILTDNYFYSLALNPNDSLLWLGAINGSVYTLSTISGEMENVDFSKVSQKSGFIRDIVADSLGMWLLKYGDGLIRYKNQTKEFVKLKNDIENTIEYGRTLFLANNGKLWVGGEKGLMLINTKEEKIEQVFDASFLLPINGQSILTIEEDAAGLIWLGTDQGLFSFNPNGKLELKEFSFNGANPIKSRVTKLLFDSKGFMWIGTLNKGLFIWDNSQKKLEQYKNELNNAKSLSSDYIIDIFEDRSDIIWISTSGYGLSKTKNKPNKLAHFTKTSSGNSLNNTMVRAFWEENDSTIWVGTGGGGLQLFNPKRATFSAIKPKVSFKEMNSELIWDIEPDKKGNLYLGVSNGFVKYNIKKGSYKSTILDSEPIIVPRLHFFNDTTLLVGTLGKGLFFFNTKTEQLKRFVNNRADSTSLPNNFMFAFAPHNKNSVWVGTFGGGLVLFDFKTQKFRSFHSIYPNSDSFDSKITVLFRENEFILWVGTSNGLNKVDLSTGEVQHFQEADGLPNNYIYAIEKDDKGMYWVSSNKGLTRIDFSRHGRDRFLNYNSNDGLQSVEFNTNASLKAKNGDLYFGGVNGFNKTNPNLIKTSIESPPLSISKYMINNERSVLFIEKSKNQIYLNPEDNIIAFDIASLDYTNSSFNQFAYKLEGFNEDWVYIGNRNFIQFTNLKPDSYDFYLKATNSDGIWSKPIKKATITVLPPYWATWWFRSLFVFLLVGSLASYVSRVQQRKKELQRVVREQTEEISKSEVLFRMISENIADTILVINSEMQLEYVSPSIKLLLGYEPASLFSTNPLSLVHQDDLRIVNKAIFKAFAKRKNQIIEFRMLHQNGSYRIMNATTSSGIKDNEEQSSVIAVVRDVTELRSYEQALIQSRQEAIEANKAKSMFLAGMSHELRTPLNAILGFAQILQQDEEIPRRKRDFIQTMYKSGNHLLRMINDVLDFSKIEAGKQEVKPILFDLMSMAYELESMFALECQRKNLGFEFEFESSTPRFIKSDPAKLQQVLINLIGNAVKFTEKGKVTFQIKAVNLKNDSHCTIKFIVADTGPGIAENEIDSIFEPFLQLDYAGKKGTGLGLSISKKLVDLLDGKVSLTSKINEGSTFELSLPVDYELIMDMDSNEDYEKWHYEGLKILVVDDIETNREMAKEMLQQYNMQVVIAESGEHCLKQLANYDVNVILMDYLMPILDGEKTLKKIRENHAFDSIPVIALTAYGLNKLGEEFLEMGFDGYLSKPLSKKELLNEIARVAQLTLSSKTDTKQTLKELTIQAVAAAILDLDEVEKVQWIDNLEVLDLDSIAPLLAKSSLSKEMQEEISREIEQLNYRYFISLNDLLS